MPVLFKYYLVLIFCLSIAMAIGVVASRMDSLVVVLGMFVWIVFSTLFLRRYRCPVCGAPITNKEKRALTPGMSAFVGPRCRTCGSSLLGDDRKQ